MPEPLRVAYTVEQCWHRVPGGTATAALEVARRLERRDDIELVPVAGRHRVAPPPAFVPPSGTRSLPLARPWLYETWNRVEWPRIERVAGSVDLCHSTTSIPAATAAPHVVTVHDVEFLDAPERLTRRGVRVMRRGLERCRAADLVLCPSRVTATRLAELGFERVRVVPWGVDPVVVGESDEQRIRKSYDLPDSFVLFVGTIEPRKNLAALSTALARSGLDLPLVAAGAEGWGDGGMTDDVRFLGFVAPGDLAVLYAAATLFAYPSLSEGFGLPVAEAMSYGTPVVTSRGTSTEEVAGGAAVLVDPTDVDSISEGLVDAARRSEELCALGLERAAALTWDATVDATVDAYRTVVG